MGVTLQTTGKLELEYLDVGEGDFDMTYVEGDWMILELSIDDEGAYCRATTADGAETRHIDSGGTGPGASLAVLDATGTVEVDAFHMRYRRVPQAANAGVSWLGQSGE